MELWEQIIDAYPEIKATDNFRELGIHIRDNGNGAFIEKWEYSQPLPDGMKIGE